jgi:polyribonucleotide nucleotidyltransferase
LIKILNWCSTWISNNDKIWIIIGKNGNTINNIQRLCDVKIYIIEQINKVSIKGNQENILYAKQAIYSVFNNWLLYADTKKFPEHKLNHIESKAGVKIRYGKVDNRFEFIVLIIDEIRRLIEEEIHFFHTPTNMNWKN